jgi:hypothetical protein
MDLFLWWTGAVFWTLCLGLSAAKAVRMAGTALRKRRGDRMLRAALLANGIDEKEAARLKVYWRDLFAKTTSPHDDNVVDRHAPL